MPYGRLSAWRPAYRRRPASRSRRYRRAGRSYSSSAGGITQGARFRPSMAITAPKKAELKRHFFNTFDNPVTRAPVTIVCDNVGRTFPLAQMQSAGVLPGPGPSAIRDGRRIRGSGFAALTLNARAQCDPAGFATIRFLVLRSRVPTSAANYPTAANILLTPTMPATSVLNRDSLRNVQVLADRIIDLHTTGDDIRVNLSLTIPSSASIEYNDVNGDDIMSGALFMLMVSDRSAADNPPKIQAAGMYSFVDV